MGYPLCDKNSTWAKSGDCLTQTAGVSLRQANTTSWPKGTAVAWSAGVVTADTRVEKLFDNHDKVHHIENNMNVLDDNDVVVVKNISGDIAFVVVVVFYVVLLPTTTSTSGTSLRLLLFSALFSFPLTTSTSTTSVLLSFFLLFSFPLTTSTSGDITFIIVSLLFSFPLVRIRSSWKDVLYIIYFKYFLCLSSDEMSFSMYHQWDHVRVTVKSFFSLLGWLMSKGRGVESNQMLSCASQQVVPIPTNGHRQSFLWILLFCFFWCYIPALSQA